VKALTEAGFHVARQKGSHLILLRNEYVVPVPKHKDIKRGLLMEIIAKAGFDKRGILKANKGKITFKPALSPF